jgi:predicted dehydrogenase
VTRIYYVEALTRLEIAGAVKVVGIFDPDRKAMATVGQNFPTAVATTSFEQLLGLDAKAAIIASPPSFHADQSVSALRAGLHIFCEKPLATTSADANRILEIAQQMSLSASIGLVRRHFPAAQSIKKMLQAKAIGRLHSVTCFEGGPFVWPVASPRYFGRSESGGGVLQDIGTHCLDLLTWWLGPPEAIHYTDDAMGGIEANCFLRLSYRDFDASVRLSRDWHRPNLYRFEGDCGWISWMINDPAALETSISSDRADDIEPSRQSLGFADCFAAQIVCFLDSVLMGTPQSTPASAGAAVLALIERCYATRCLMDMPWLGSDETVQAARLAT